MKLVDWMKKNGVLQKDLAERMGTDQGHVSRLVNQKYVPETQTIALIKEITKGEVDLPDWLPPPLKRSPSKGPCTRRKRR